MSAEPPEHVSVLYKESLDALAIVEDGIYVDGTFGRGGHSQAILDRLGQGGRLFALDKDPEALEYAKETLEEDSRFTIVQSSFAELERMAQQWGIVGNVNGVLLDLGVSSPQLDDASRGFSFRQDGPLDMRMNPEQGKSAAEWLATVKEADLTQVIKTYGEERYAKRIARAIVNTRAKQAINTTSQLAKIVAEAHPAWEKGKHPATRTFQAIRIYINQELDDLKSVLGQAADILAPGGRLAVISFHSLEDKIVKQFIQRESSAGDIPPGLGVPESYIHRKLKRVGKMIHPSEQECQQNSRARSARLRIAEKM